MKRKLLTIVLSLIAALCLCFGLAACDDGSTPDTGTADTDTEQGAPQTPDEDDKDPDVDEDKDPDGSNKDDKGPDDGGDDDKNPDVGDDKDPDEDDDDSGEHVHTFTVDNVCSECGTAWEYTDGLAYELDPETDTYIVAKNDGVSGDIVIPYGYQGKWVTRIGKDAFDYESLTSVTIPDSVTSIESYAFNGCSGLTSIAIPESVTSIGIYAFIGCSGLQNVIWNAKNCIIGGIDPISIFMQCALRSVTFGSNVQSIPALAFINCDGLKEVHIHDLSAWCGIRFESYAANPLYYAHHLYMDNVEMKKIIIPNGITEIKPYAFCGGAKLTSVIIPDSVTSIGEKAFWGTAYYDDQSHWDASGVLYIDNHLIEAKHEILGSYTIKKGIKTVASDAFGSCSGLTSITIPDSVTSIGSSAFGGCSGLTEIYITDLSAWCKIDFGDEYANPLRHANHLYVNNVELKELTIPNDITEIKPYAFYGYSKLTSIEISNSVTSIGQYAFCGCSGLTSITIGSGVTSIEFGAFERCSGLTSITIPDSVTEIGDYAFEYCSALTSVTIPDSVTSIGIYAFCGCSRLTSITIPDSVTSIESSAFRDSGLTSITIPDSVTEIGNYAFENCSALTSVTIPNSVTSIRVWAFATCKGLTDIQFKGTVKEWQAIEKRSYWNSNTGNYTITCTDGTIDKSGKVTYFAQ